MSRINDWDLTDWILVMIACVVAWFIFLKPAGDRINRITSGEDAGANAPASTCSVTHTVGQSEYLSTIAVHYGTTWQSLASLNGLANPDYLRVGQKLCITK